MKVAIILAMVRRTITLPDELETQVRDAAGEDESFSAAVARLLEAGLSGRSERLAWIGSGDSGDPDLAFRVEEVLDELAAEADVND
jgi:hypothetical protein